MSTGARPGSPENPHAISRFEPPEAEGGSIESTAQHVCEERCWADILYLPGTRTFWLLTEEVSEILLEASETLSEWVQEEDPAKRLRKLTEDAGLECLLPARAENFLDESERQRYREAFERLVELTQDDEASLEARIAHQRTMWDHLYQFSTPGMLEFLNRRIRRDAQEVSRLERQLRQLYQQGLERAREQGYRLEDEGYFGPWEAEIATALEAYRSHRAQAQREYHFNPGGQGEATPFSLQDVLAEYQRFIQLCESMPPREAANECRFVGYVQQLSEQQESKYNDYLHSILTLASLGIATPELALSSPNPQLRQLRNGVEAFDAYCRTLKESLELHQAVENKLREWESGTGGQTQLPVFLFEQERQRYETLQETLNELHERARQAVEEMEPGRVLVWHTDIEDDRHALGYQKRKIELLVQNDFPLREFSSPQGQKSLSHISLLQMIPTMTGNERWRLERTLRADGVLPARLWDAPESALSQWLQGRGCQAIAHRLDWHDEPMGFFEPERFFAYLETQGHEVASLDDASRQAWGEALQKILFTGPSREELRLFDASAQAQMLRLVGMARRELNEARQEGERDTPWDVTEHAPSLTFFDLEMEGSRGGSLGVESRSEVAFDREEPGLWILDANDEWSPSVDLTYSWEAKGTFSLARGELPLGRLVLPSREQARPVVATLTDRGEQRELGRYAIVLDAVAKGFAGASVALATEVGFSFDKDGLSVSGIDWVKREATGATVDAFAGARLGIETRCEVHWEPPENLLRILPQRAAMASLGMHRPSQSLSGWRSIGVAQLDAEVAAGIGGKLGFVLGMKNGKFVFKVSGRFVLGKGAGGGLAIELDPDSLDLWLVMLHRAMVDNNFEKPEWIDQEAYESMNWLAYIATTTLLNVGLLAARGRTGIERIYRAMTGGQKAGPIAYVLVNDPRKDELRSWVQQLSPEALGALLHLLVSEPRAFEVEASGRGRGGSQSFSARQALDFQQIAISNCLGWIVEGVTMSVYGAQCRFSHVDPTPAQYLFTKAVVRMTAIGQPPHNYPDVAYANHKHHLDRFMERVSGSGALIERDAGIARADYRRYAGGLGVINCAV
ncbi:hypothetical protein [Billgrantia aerodenitrificans]|uniref:Uncharacterized protein n=1 Tax=Billgrantia aerodenitrificans TaxID=2733483 RepID=A0ABS9AUD6_9GAMM|nr:hypothetical protein [Halomonas aerodenitrificans]MCE8025481.1 hypothetical protein [Halomonas aerodenitrificans]